MYCLVFKDEDDQTSNLTIDWLGFLKKKVLVVNNDIVSLVKLKLLNNSFEFILINHSIEISLMKISSYWLRRGRIYLWYPDVENNLKYSKEKIEYLNSETNRLHDCIMTSIYSKHGIGRHKLNQTDKIYNLKLASDFGLSIPKTYVSQYLQYIKFIVNQNNTYCTKAIGQSFYQENGFNIGAGSHLVNNKDLELISEHSNGILIQDYQDKKYELRIFYLDGDFYTSAIFSQNDEQTKVDFRNYNNIRPNRTPPFKLPKDIENKLHNLMQKLTIKCGSIDMVVNTNNEFVFLEVNPFGQFQQVSFPCNYYLELKVAEYLTKYDKREETVC